MMYGVCMYGWIFLYCIIHAVNVKWYEVCLSVLNVTVLCYELQEIQINKQTNRTKTVVI